MNNPKDLVTQKIVDYCKQLQIIFVIGFTKTGKVTIAKELAKQLNYDILIADDFIENYGHDGALTMFKNEVERKFYNGDRFIVEGVLCFRLLRKLINTSGIIPDLIIKTECDDQTIRYFYEKEEPNKNLSRVFGFNQGLQKIFEEYIDFLYIQNKQVKVLKLNTSIY